MKVEGFDQLLRAAQAGNREALEELLEQVRPYLAKVATGYADPSRASQSVSDLLQEIELRIWQRLGQFEGGAADEETQAKFRAWIVQIVRRIAYDQAKARHRKKRKAPGFRLRSLDAAASTSSDASRGAAVEVSSPDPTPSEGLRQSEELLRLRKAIAEILEENDRRIIRLYFFEGLSLGRIAERLGWTHDRVRDHYRRSIRRLEKHFEDLEAR